MYSEELSLFVLDAGIRFLEQDEPPVLLYLSLTDYIQHKYAPDHPAALAFHAALDDRFARLEELGATVALTADHGMKDKCAEDGSYNIVYLQDLLDERFGAGGTKVICPITDAFRRTSRITRRICSGVLLRRRTTTRRCRVHSPAGGNRTSAGTRAGGATVRPSR